MRGSQGGRPNDGNGSPARTRPSGRVGTGVTFSRTVARLLAGVLFLAAGPGSLLAQERHLPDAIAPSKKFVTPRTRRSIDDGLAYLASRQRPDGSFGSGSIFERNVAVTSLAGMAFLSGGHAPDRGKYGRNVTRAVDFVLSRCQPNGFITDEQAEYHGPMYGHGFATLFLAEVYGMTRRKDVRTKLKAAVDLIVNTQNDEGGWRYDPVPKEADVSVTACQMMALRAARNCGLHVPKETVTRCVDYVKDCQHEDGGFKYRRTRGESLFPRSAAATVALYNSGLDEENSPELRRAVKYLYRYKPSDAVLRYETHYYYGHYYAAQAMWQTGETGPYWPQWYPAVRDQLVGRQLPSGAWSAQRVCPEYGTAMSLLVLQMPNNYLPIFQK